MSQEQVSELQQIVMNLQKRIEKLEREMEQTLSVYLPETVLKEIKDWSDVWSVSLSEAALRIIKEWLAAEHSQRQSEKP